MKRFTIDFKHTVEETYTAIIDAETEEEAMEMFNESPFDYLMDEEPSQVDGLSIDVINTEEEDI